MLNELLFLLLQGLSGGRENGAREEPGVPSRAQVAPNCTLPSTCAPIGNFQNEKVRAARVDLAEQLFELLRGLRLEVLEVGTSLGVAVVDNLAHVVALNTNVYPREAIEGLKPSGRGLAEVGLRGPLDGVPPTADELLHELALERIVELVLVAARLQSIHARGNERGSFGVIVLLCE